VRALVEGKADAFFHHSSAPMPAMMEAELTTPFRLLPLDEKAIDHLLDKLPWTARQTIPANTYKGQTEEVKWTYSQAGVFVRKDLPDGLVYDIAQAVDQNMPELRAVKKDFFNWQFKNLVNGPYGPYHAGAFKYYMDRGYLTPESVKKHEAWLKEIGQES